MENTELFYEEIEHLNEDSYTELKRSLAQIHGLGFIHSDICHVNILMKRKDTTGSVPLFVFLDWDLAGKVGQAQYPSDMNIKVP